MPLSCLVFPEGGRNVQEMQDRLVSEYYTIHKTNADVLSLSIIHHSFWFLQ